MAISSLARATKLSVSAQSSGFSAKGSLTKPNWLAVATRQLKEPSSSRSMASRASFSVRPLVDLVSKVNRHNFRIVFGVEADLALFVAAAELVIIRNVAVVNNGQVGELVAAKRLRVAEVDFGLGGKSRVAKTVSALELRNAVGLAPGWRGSRLA